MNINVYLENEIAKQLRVQAETFGMTRNAVIREALRFWLIHHKAQTWPSVVLHYQGDEKFPAFESHRKELKKAKDDPFA